MTRRSQEIWIGLFVVLGLLLLGVLIATFGKLRKAGQSYYRLTTYFKTATGIEPGTPVTLMGITVGEVEKRWIDADRVMVVMKIDSSYSIRSDAGLSIKSKGIMGDYYLEFDSGSIQAKHLPTDGTAPAIAGRPPAMDEIIRSIRGLAATVTERAADKETWDKFKEAIDSLSETIKKTPDLVEKAEQTTSEVRELVGGMRQLVTELTSVAQGTREFTGNLDQQITQVSGSVQQVTASLLTNAEELQKSLSALNHMLERVREIDEKEVYQQMLTVLTEGRQLIAEVSNTIRYFRRYPEAFLWGAVEPMEEK